MKTENWIHGWLKSIWKKTVWENPSIKKQEEPIMSNKKLTEFDDIIEVVLEHEGGYVNDPKDPGG